MISKMMFWVIFAHVVWDQLKSNINLLTNTGVIIVLIDWVNFYYIIMSAENIVVMENEDAIDFKFFREIVGEDKEFEKELFEILIKIFLNQ